MSPHPIPPRAVRIAEPPGFGWQPIETAPRDGTPVQVYAPAMGESLAWWLPAAEIWAEAIGSGYMAPYQDWTHWRPAPDEDG